MRKRLEHQLKTIEFVGTTADILSTARRSYMGITLNWLDPPTLKRKSAAISCAQMKGTHNFEVIAKQINEIHFLYNIQNKVNFYFKILTNHILNYNLLQNF